MPENYDITYDEYQIKVTVLNKNQLEFQVELPSQKVEFGQSVTINPEISGPAASIVQYQWYKYDYDTKTYDFVSQKES